LIPSPGRGFGRAICFREDEDGYYWYVSRADNVIISAGYRIGPGEVEDTLLNHPAVEEAAVVGADHDTRGNIVKAYVTLVDEYSPDDELGEEIQEFARSELSKHEYPREVAFLEALPKTASGENKAVRPRRLTSWALRPKDAGTGATPLTVT